MKTRMKMVIGAAAIATSLAGLAAATPLFNLASPVLATASDETKIDTHGEFELADGKLFKVSLKTDGPSTILNQEAAYGAKGHNGWHSHPGLVTVALIAGTIEWYNERCESKTYSAGDAWTEGSQIHYFRNVGKVNVQLIATYVIAKGEAPRIDQPAPACAAALGLD